METNNQQKKKNTYKKEYQMIQSSVSRELLHGMVVSRLASALGAELGLSEKECYDLALAGLLHDIG